MRPWTDVVEEEAAESTRSGDRPRGPSPVVQLVRPQAAQEDCAQSSPNPSAGTSSRDGDWSLHLSLASQSVVGASRRCRSRYVLSTEGLDLSSRRAGQRTRPFDHLHTAATAAPPPLGSSRACGVPNTEILLPDVLHHEGWPHGPPQPNSPQVGTTRLASATSH